MIADELALATSTDPAELAVYADALQARGDLRGELIALDLHAEAHGATAELDARRAELMVGWLGASYAHHPAIRRRYGALELWLVDDKVAEDDALLATLFHGVETSPHRLVIHGSSERIAAALAHVAIARRPRLTQLVLYEVGHGGTIPKRVAASIIAATPNLRELTVDGRVFGTLPHPNIRKLHVTGFDALALGGAQLAMPAIEELDLEFRGRQHRYASDRLDPTVLDQLLVPAGIPALRRLDLTRNEPGGLLLRHRTQGDVSMFRWLRGLKCRRQLTHLRLPSLRTDGDATNAQVAIDAMADLVELEVVRGYRSSQRTLAHPRARVTIAPAVSWPATDELPYGNYMLAVTIPNVDAPIAVDLPVGVALMTAHYAQLPAVARAAWDQLWRALDGFAWVRPAPGAAGLAFPVAVLHQAVESCANHAIARSGWPALHSALRDRARGGSTTVMWRHM